MELNTGQIINGRYEILEKIGVGGTANVYCAKDLKLERKITFKVLKEEFIDKDFIKRFSTEAQAAAKLSHTNIANVYDVGNENDIYYIVMEYIDGYTLKELIKSKVPFDDKEAIGIAMQICSALENAHTNNIIHKDIKPQNILVTKEGIVKVTDFGLAKTITSTTITTDTMGSVHYFSPEQARGGYVDNKTDIYSLGIIMYEMATGELPFNGDSTVQLAMQHINSEIPNIKNLNDEISESLIKIIYKCTEKNSSNRYSSASELKKDLQKALINKTGDFINSNNKFDENDSTIIIDKKEIDEINRLDKMQKVNKNSKNTNNKNSYDYDKVLGKKVTIYAILTSILIMIIISIPTWNFLSNLNKIKVPNFLGKSWEQAVKIASKNEIYIKNIKEEYSQSYKSGVIIGQDISPNTKIKKGETIGITLSLGSDKFILPDFKGLDISEVYEQLADHEVNLNEEYVYSTTVEMGKVIRQIPSSGKEVSIKDSITLYISRGKESTSVSVPNLAGMTIDNASAALSSIGLYIGNINYSSSNSIEKGLIINQSVKAGSEIDSGKSVSVVVSSGKYEEPKYETSIKDEDLKNEEENASSNEDVNPTENIEVSTDTQEETTPIIKRETLVVSVNLEETDEQVEVKIIQVNSSGESEVYLNQHNYSDLPLRISVSGSEPTEFKIYINGIYSGSETKSFE